MNFECKNCRYRFKSDLDQKNKSCPYCGKKSIIPESTVDELLSEID